MLDFLREQENISSDSLKVEPKSGSKQKGRKSKSWDNQASSVSQQSTEKNNESDKDFLSVDTRAKSLQKSTILLVSVVIIGMAGLFFMIKKGTPNLAIAEAVDAEQAQIDFLIAKLGGVRSEMSSRMDKIIKKFYEYSNPKQIPVDRLGKNPFRMSSFWAGMDEYSHRDLQKMIGSKGNYSFQLFSIIRPSSEGEKSSCVIDDKILTEGDSISGMKVTQIGDNFVKLESGEGQILLELNSED